MLGWIAYPAARTVPTPPERCYLTVCTVVHVARVHSKTLLQVVLNKFVALGTLPRFHRVPGDVANRQFLKADGDTHEMNHVFYPTTRNLYVATIQSLWEPNLRGLLKNRTVRVRVWCTNDERAEYLFFRVSGESATCDDIEDLCEVRLANERNTAGNDTGQFLTSSSLGILRHSCTLLGSALVCSCVE